MITHRVEWIKEPVKPDPVDFLPSPSENVTSPVSGEISNFTRPVCDFHGATLTYPSYTIYVCLKKGKQRSDRKGKPAGKLADQVTCSSKTR